MIPHSFVDPWYARHPLHSQPCETRLRCHHGLKTALWGATHMGSSAEQMDEASADTSINTSTSGSVLSWLQLVTVIRFFIIFKFPGMGVQLFLDPQILVVFDAFVQIFELLQSHNFYPTNPQGSARPRTALRRNLQMIPSSLLLKAGNHAWFFPKCLKQVKQLIEIRSNTSNPPILKHSTIGWCTLDCKGVLRYIFSHVHIILRLSRVIEIPGPGWRT